MQRIRNIFAVVRPGIVGSFCLLSLAGLSACSNPVDNSPNHIPLRSDDAVDDAGDVSGTAAGCDCMKVGDIFRFTTLQLTSVDGNPDFAVIPVLNSLWQTDIDNFELNFIVRVTGVSDTAVDVVVTNGARVGTTKQPCLLESTAAKLHFPRQGCNMLNSDPGSMNVYSGTQQHPKNCGYLAETTPPIGVDHSIPIRGAILSSSESPDCQNIINGQVIAGSFSKDALYNLCTCQTLPGQSSDVCSIPDKSYKDTTSTPPGACDGCGPGWQSLGGLLAAFAGDAGLQYGCKSDTNGPAVCLTATFAAKKLDPAVWLPSDCTGT